MLLKCRLDLRANQLNWLEAVQDTFKGSCGTVDTHGSTRHQGSISNTSYADYLSMLWPPARHSHQSTNMTSDCAWYRTRENRAMATPQFSRLRANLPP